MICNIIPARPETPAIDGFQQILGPRKPPAECQTLLDILT
jgi:hypothetical protein